tara:strand:+ start:70988 stop:71308 length:321 start_codon:yes stop_codon:yes gene_type:complete
MLVVIESPYAGNIEENIRYARACMSDALKRGESPFASHLLYTQDGILNDEILLEREQGIAAGFEWGKHADKCAVYTDLGVSEGMKRGIENAEREGIPIVFRNLENY